MSHKCGTRRTRADELSAPAAEDDEPTPGLTSPEVLAPEHLDEPYAQAYGAQTVPSRVQSPLRVAGTAHRGSDSPRQVAVASGTATQGPHSPQGMDQGSESWQNLGDALSDPDHVSPDVGDTNEEHFTIPASEVTILHQEYTEFINLKDNAEIVLSEAMEATERLNTVFNHIRTSMNRMSPRMKEIFIGPSKKASGKMHEPGNNRAHDKAAAKAATERIVAQTATMEPVPESGTDDRVRLTQSRVYRDGDRHSLPPRHKNIRENIPHAAPSEQSDDSQPQCGRDAHTGYVCATRDEHVTTQSRTRYARDIRVTEGTRVNSQESTCRRCDVSPINTRHEPVSVNTRDRYNLSADQVIQGVPESIECSRCSIRDPQSIDMNALREEIKETISATIKEKLCSDADSVTTVSQSILALGANAQYWSNLSNKAARRSRRALELQLKLAEEKVNTLLHEEAPEEALLEAAQEVRTIHFQLDQNTRLREAGLMPEQQVRFSADTGRNVTSPSKNYGVNPINEAHIPQPEADAPFGRQGTPSLSISAQLDGAVVDMTSEYSGIQQMVRQAIKNASHEEEPEKSFLAKAGVKMENPPTYSGECNLEKFENWVASVLRYMLMYNLLGPQAERFDREIKHWDLESVMMGLQKWFMSMLSLNKVAVNYDRIMQGSMTVQQLHQELTKLAKQMVELPDAYSYRRRFMDVLKPDIRGQVLNKGFTAEFSKIDELVEQAVMFDNAKCYTSGYNSNHGSAYLHKTATAEHSCAQHTTTQNRSSNLNAGSSNQHKSGSNTVQSHPTTQLLSTGGGGCESVTG
ncbi:hypothetical protein M422DRAFT_265941 [Sphaerobolus stellatus SS14]|uniref:Uncharacterized protein n=1 Tax=Sphaerobolus stellatus (strain SS14) TaxID=990650 RepID=A0A0C9V450_SPHS4|nr:hypothetical protein M422DRAFT_265941 [Sphaerobolus stellatus SS14]